MKIAFILSNGSISQSNGVISQAKTWKKGLEQRGHTVDLIDMWNPPAQWNEYMAVVYFGFSHYMTSHIKYMSKINKNIFVAPILDPTYSTQRLWIYAHWGVKKLNLTNAYHSLNSVKHLIKGFLVRSEFEQNYIIKGFGVDKSICGIIPLSFDVPNLEDAHNFKKEDFCLHISLLTDERKNVKRLIEAAKKYNFKLVLGGKLRSEDDKKLLHKWIGNANNIEYRGFLSNEDKVELYRKAKVFALPSVNEGVGIVALEAASLGCDVVITSLGGPKEYYGKLAKTVNPYSVKDIGEAICYFLQGESFQPQLQKHIIESYNLSSISEQLESMFNS